MVWIAGVPLARHAVRGVPQVLGARGQSAAGEFAFGRAIDCQKRLAQGRQSARARQAVRQALGIATSRGKLFDGAGQCRAESGQPDHTRKLGRVEAGRGLFDDQVEERLGDRGQIGGKRLHEPRERLDDGWTEDEALARQLILEVLGHGGGGGEHAHAGVAAAEGIAEAFEDAGGLAGPCGTTEK